MGKTKRKQQRIPIDRWIALLWGGMGILGYALWISLMVQSCVDEAHEKATNHPPEIQEFRLAREVVPVGETVSARVIATDSDEGDEIHYFWAAHSGIIGEQLDRFQGPEVTYVAPDLPGVDVITVAVFDSEGETDEEFKFITVIESGKR